MMAQQLRPAPTRPPATIATNAGVGQKRGREDGGDDLDAEPVKQKLRIGEMELADEDNWLDANTGTSKVKILCPDCAQAKNLTCHTIDL